MEWLDRALIVSPYYYCLCTTEKQFHSKLRWLKIAKSEWPSFVLGGANATVHYFERGTGELVAIVNIDGKKGRSIPQVHALLVHEAVHIWQRVKESIRERNPSDEFEAYSIQTLSQRLIESYEKQRKGKR